MMSDEFRYSSLIVYHSSLEKMELFDQIGNIELKIRQLTKRFKRLDGENVELLEENRKLKETLENREANFMIFKEKIKQIKERFEAAESDSDFEKTERYLREINQCVEWFKEQ